MRNSRLMVQGAAVLALGMLAAGCASIKDHRGYIMDEALVATVQPGVDNKLSVERTLGRPTFISEFGEPAWYYVAIDTKQSPMGRPRTSGQLITRVRFDAAGNVLSIDKRGTEKIVRLNPDGHKTPTLGKQRSFIEDLFGNIGSVGAPGMGGGGGGGPGTGPNGS